MPRRTKQPTVAPPQDPRYNPALCHFCNVNKLPKEEYFVNGIRVCEQCALRSAANKKKR